MGFATTPRVWFSMGDERGDASEHRGTSLITNSPPPWGRHRSLGILLVGFQRDAVSFDRGSPVRAAFEQRQALPPPHEFGEPGLFSLHTVDSKADRTSLCRRVVLPQADSVSLVSSPDNY